MTQPTAYDPSTSFDSFNPSSFPSFGRKLDVELENVQTTTDEIRANLALIQRDDGDLANESVGRDQLKDEVRAGINTPAAWATATDYSVRDSVTRIVTGSTGYTRWYKCVTAHTSDDFDTDLATGYWDLILEADAGPTGPTGAAGAGSPSDAISPEVAAGAGAIGTSEKFARQDHAHPFTDPLTTDPFLAVTGAVTATITAGTTAMTDKRRYRITGGTGTLPTMAAGSFVVVEMKPAEGVTVTIGRNAQTIDGASEDDTYTGDDGSGLLMLYAFSSAGAVKSQIIGSVQ